MKRNGGFSLVELMVAMVIGLIIILGAGQLFLTVFQTNRQVERLSEKQAAVNFSVESLLRDVRRANKISVDDSGARDEVSLRVNNREDMTCSSGEKEVSKIYRLTSSTVGEGLGRAIEMAQACGGTTPSSFQQLVAGFEDSDDAFELDDALLDSRGVLRISLRLISTDQGGAADDLVFYAVRRTAALAGDGG